MTREEKLEKYLDYQYMYENGDPSYINGIKVGVSWADKNPKSPWISVEERLPDRLPAKFANWSKEVFVAVKRGREYRAYVDKYSHIYKTWNVFGDEVTYWMPIPELPKEE